MCAFWLYGAVLFSLSHFEEHHGKLEKKWFAKYMDLCIICFFAPDSVLLECCHSEMNIIFQGAVKMPPLLKAFLIPEHW